jgi:hypothetical protein
MGEVKTVLIILVAMLPVGALQSSDLYLPCIGPAPLRFAAATVNYKNFAWPVPLNTGRSTTNSTEIANLSGSNAATNSTASLPPSAPQTNNTPVNARVPLAPDVTVSSPANPPQMPIGADGNPLSASNLLIVTPQMLADYFKATLNNADRSSTNAPAGPEVLFNPPTPKPPSSEAIYRSQ